MLTLLSPTSSRTTHWDTIFTLKCETLCDHFLSKGLSVPENGLSSSITCVGAALGTVGGVHWGTAGGAYAAAGGEYTAAAGAGAEGGAYPPLPVSASPAVRENERTREGSRNNVKRARAVVTNESTTSKVIPTSVESIHNLFVHNE